MRIITRKNNSIRDKTLEQMRKLRQQFEKDHPDLLEKIRNEIKRQGLYSAPIPPEQPETDHELVINREKNIETVLKFTRINNGSAEFQQKLKELLLSIQH